MRSFMRDALSQYQQSTDERTGPDPYRLFEFYTIHFTELSLELQETFVQLDFDEGTREFLDAHVYQPGYATTLRDLVWRATRCCLSHTDTNSLLGRGEMHVLSLEQARKLLAPEEGTEIPSGPRKARRLLDIGAGTGAVTVKLAPMFDECMTTEVSRMAARAIRARGIPCSLASLPTPDVVGYEPYDVVACLNVLDRCHTPGSILDAMRDRMGPDGFGLLAIVLPYKPSVEDGTKWIEAAEPLDVSIDRKSYRAHEKCSCGAVVHNKKGAPFSAWVQWMADRVLKPRGFRIVRWTRVPYLSQGDKSNPFYVLSDAIFVLKRDVPEAGAPPAWRE